MSSLVVIGYMNMVDIPCILKFLCKRMCHLDLFGGVVLVEYGE